MSKLCVQEKYGTVISGNIFNLCLSKFKELSNQDPGWCATFQFLSQGVRGIVFLGGDL